MTCAQVYVEVAVTQPADFFLLLITKCWATQTPQPNATEGSHHTLLQNGCDLHPPRQHFITVWSR